MQPYFIPYAGYMRLLACSDIFVVYDCVQFPRRSWVHRNKLKLSDGSLDWFTLPIQKADFDEKIKNIYFREDAAVIFEEAITAFPAFLLIRETYPELYHLLNSFDSSLSTYNVAILSYLAHLFNFTPKIIYSSSLNIPESYKGQERIIKIVEALKGSHYINAPGGVSLYDESAFATRGICLDFLSEYVGDFSSILQLMTENDMKTLGSTILNQCHFMTTRNMSHG